MLRRKGREEKRGLQWLKTMDADKYLSKVGFGRKDWLFWKHVTKALLCTYALVGAAWVLNETSPFGWWSLSIKPKEEKDLAYLYERREFPYPGDQEAMDEFVARGGMIGTAIGPKGIVELDKDSRNFQKELQEQKFEQEAFKLWTRMRNEVSVHGNDGEVWMEKQAAMEAIIADLQNQKDLLSQKEKVNKKLLDSLQADNSRLYLQIKELEKSQSYLLGENEQLSEKISNMQSQIQNLERIISSNNFSTESLEVNESGVDSGLPTQVLKSEFEIPTPDHDQRSRDTAPEPGIEDMESQMGEVVVDRRVPLSHAPLIGAPFRLISFVAGYVSGADLLTIQ